MGTPVSGLLRPVYFDRQQLTAADLKAEQDYVAERLRRHNRYLHGWGVVCGAQVQQAGPWSLAVGPGYALTPLGDEVLLPPGLEPFDFEDDIKACIGVVDPCLPAEEVEPVTTCLDFSVLQPNTTDRNPRKVKEISFFVTAENNQPAPATEIRKLGNFIGLFCDERLVIDLPRPAVEVTMRISFAVGAPIAMCFDSAGNRLAAITLNPQNGQQQTVRFTVEGIRHVVVQTPPIFTAATATLLEEFCSTVRQSPGRDVYLVACPDAEMRCPRPLVPKDCQPPGGASAWSRARESFRLEIRCDLPSSHLEPPLSCETLQEIVCGQAHVPCPPAVEEGDNCVVLASILAGADGIIRVDDLRDRRQLLSESLMLEYQRCRCGEQPPPTTTPPPITVTPPTTTPPPVTVLPPTTSPPFTVPPVSTLPPFTIPPVSTIPPISTIPPFTIPPDITDLTIGPFTMEPGGGIFDPIVFDVDRGRTLPVTEIPNIGEARARRLREEGVTNVLDFAVMPTEKASRILGLSEVAIAEMQERARSMMRRV